MKRKTFRTLLNLALCLLATAPLARAQTTAFTYQGKLADGCCPATGLYDFFFGAYDAATGGTQLPAGNPHGIAKIAVPVTDGLFTVNLDFGTDTATIFSGPQRWLNIEVRTNNPAVAYVNLIPRTELTSTPCALYAQGAGSVSDGAITSAQIATAAVGSNQVANYSINGQKIANGAVVRSLNGLTENVNLVAGENVTLTPSGNNIEVSATGGGSHIAAPYITIDGTANQRVFLGADNVGNDIEVGCADPGVATVSFYNPGYDGWMDTHMRGLTADGNAIVAGNVGIGTDNPGRRLTIVAGFDRDGVGVVGSASARPSYNYANQIAPGAYAYASHYLDGNKWKLHLASIGPGVDALTVTQGGNVGIGTSDPAARLDVNGNIRVEPNDHGNPGNIVLTAGSVDGTALYCHSYGRPFRAHNDYTGTDVVLAGGLAAGFTGDISVSGNASVCSLTIRGGCDLAEPFQMSEEKIPEGSVVVIDESNPGHLKQATRAYDTRVAGIISGANGINPGISLHQEGALEGGQNVALSGRVYALADASNGHIKPGDLLTSSDTPGHCMKVTNPVTTQGAIIGKAMSPLASGKGMVLVLVSLQ